jgi:hypothetical protein
VKLWKKVLLGVAVLLFGAGALMAWKIGPKNLIGMIRYDQRQEGRLRVGDRAPDVALVGLDGKSTVRVADSIGEKPLVLVFGSFT